VPEELDVVERLRVRGVDNGVAADLAEQLGGVVGRRDAGAIDLHEPCRCARRQHADAQRTRVRTHFGGERPHRRRGGVRIARPETRDGVERGGAVAHRAAHDVPDDEPGPRLAVVGTE